MFVRVSQTRHTKIGTLRPGVYEKAKLGAEGAKVIKALIEAQDPALKEISKKEATAELAKVKSLMPTKVEDLKVGPAATSDPDAAADAQTAASGEGATGQATE
ncbi:hypothetical protein [Epibacterium sp. Ofav1-8]|uniref:hypothetical protein n=1 Tax=Epibacterium sp. Ofav1-8 TaxID=2917735 RepID=UPI001EF59D3E|nr:hypothetical protein [Epibacterium sp. Ofav1-8]MCG7626048.1 hypothetical protein [Epibacterium sp. Ofav1-8]